MTDFEILISAVESGSLDAVREILRRKPELVNNRDELGATPLHIAALQGRREMAEMLLEQGADVNAVDSKYNATPAGWSIEYLRERGAFLGIELSDFAWAIEQGSVPWVERMLARFPKLKESKSIKGVPFRDIALMTGNPEIIKFFAK